MRALLILPCLACLATGACNQEPSFDERYNETAQTLDSNANSIEAELGRQLNASTAAHRIRTDPNAPAPEMNAATGP